MGKIQENNSHIAKTLLYKGNNWGTCRNDNFLGVTSKFSLFSHVTLHKQIYLFSLFSMYVFVSHVVLNTTPFETNQVKMINRSCKKC